MEFEALLFIDSKLQNRQTQHERRKNIQQGT